MGGKRKGKGRGIVGADVEGHVDEVLALAISSDGRYLVSGGRDRRILVWDVKEDKFVKAFEGHKDAITVRYYWALVQENTRMALTICSVDLRT